MTVWMLDTDDAEVAASGEVSDGDLVVRTSGDVVQVGVAGTGDAPVDWQAEVDPGLLPGRARLAEGATGGSGLERLDDIDGLERALQGVLTAERDRGA